MSKTFLCWRPEYGEGAEHAQKIKSDDHVEAAEECVSFNFSDWDYPDEVDLMVATVEGDVRRVRVTVHTEPVFNGFEVKAKP